MHLLKNFDPCNMPDWIKRGTQGSLFSGQVPAYSQQSTWNISIVKFLNQLNDIDGITSSLDN